MAELTLPDGRRLAYATMGDPDGRAIMVVHGTPGSARQLACLPAAALASVTGPRKEAA